MKPNELRAARTELGLTQDALADALGLENARRWARRTVSDWETGRRKVPGPVALAITFLLEKHRAHDDRND